jgi:hypothetical protein
MNPFYLFFLLKFACFAVFGVGLNSISWCDGVETKIVDSNRGSKASKD